MYICMYFFFFTKIRFITGYHEFLLRILCMPESKKTHINVVILTVVLQEYTWECIRTYISMCIAPLGSCINRCIVCMYSFIALLLLCAWYLYVTFSVPLRVPPRNRYVSSEPRRYHIHKIFFALTLHTCTCTCTSRIPISLIERQKLFLNNRTRCIFYQRRNKGSKCLPESDISKHELYKRYTTLCSYVKHIPCRVSRYIYM